MAVIVSYSGLLAKLNQARIKEKDPAVYEVIKGILQTGDNNQTVNSADVTSNSTGLAALTVVVDELIQQTYLTSTNESSFLPNSRELLAGTNITFDDTVPNKRTINSSGGSSGLDYVVLSDGANPPNPMNDGAGNFIYIPYTA